MDENHKSGILSRVQDDLKGHEAFNLHNLLDNPFTAGDFSHFTIRYDVYNGEPINIGDNRAVKHVEKNVEQPSRSKPTEEAVEEMEVDPPTNPDTSVHSSASAELNHQQGSNLDQIVKDLLKACFSSDKNTRSKIETQINAMFTDTSGMFQPLYKASVHLKASGNES